MTQKLRCVVERITYFNPENGYSVLKAGVKGEKDLVTLVGNMPDICVGTVLLVEGIWKIDKRFGSQFQVERWEETLPATAYGIEKYLGSGLVKGIGPGFAKRIVDKFGTETISIIEDNIDKLKEVPGLGEQRIKKLAESWTEQKEIKNVMLFLQDKGISTAYAVKIYKQYGKDSIEVVTANPYRLADDIWGIGFQTADKIATQLGIGKTDPSRIHSGIIYSLGKMSDEGHLFAYKDDLLKKASEILNIDITGISSILDEMISEGSLKTDEDAIYLPALYYAESGAASRLVSLLHFKGGKQLSFPNNFVAEEGSFTYDPVQISAIETAIKEKVMIITGGPGTGKTTVTRGIISVFQSMRLKIILAAPTGRAAKRMTEATGMPAQTIHSLLECRPPEGFRRNEQNPLEGDALIVDEFSMVDMVLMNSLMKALPSDIRLIMVGDVDQLPSVGPGHVLFEMIESSCIPVIKLEKIFRQASLSRIITNAHKINKGYFPDISNGQESDFFFIQEDDQEQVANLISDLVERRLPSRYKISPNTIQVLCPMRRGVTGSGNINLLLQNRLNKSEHYLHRGGYMFKMGDKVMQIRNNYEKKVFNGDIGMISEVDVVDRTLSVDFSGLNVKYDISELDELTLAYATTIHKSQGSEYPIVIIPLMMSNYLMLQRNLIYTAVTRAKKICIIVGCKKALYIATKNLSAEKRNTKFSERIKGFNGK